MRLINPGGTIEAELHIASNTAQPNLELHVCLKSGAGKIGTWAGARA
jgi:hypothetical protein